MKTLHFGTRSERISRVYYDLVWRDGCVDVVLIHTPEPGYACVLWGNDRLLTLVFGQILSQELLDAPLASIRCFSFVVTGERRLHACEIPLRIDFDSPLTRNRLRSPSRWPRWLGRLLPTLDGDLSLWSGDERVGRVEIRADFAGRRGVPDARIKELCRALRYELAVNRKLPASVTRLFHS